MRPTAILEKSLIFLAAVAVNLGLYLLVPYIQVLIQKGAHGPKAPKQVVTEIQFAQPPPEKLVKREIKEIKLASVNPPQPNPTRPTTPGGGLKIDLSPAGGEGLSLVSGGDRTGGIGSGTGNGTGAGMAAMTYEMGQADVDCKPTNNPPLNMPARAGREGIAGYVELTWIVNEFGTAEQIQIMKEQPAGYGFAKSAMETVRSTKFKPAFVQKIPVKQRVRQPFNFAQE